MADAFLSGLVSDVLRSLASTAFQEFKRLRGLKDDVEALKDTYTWIQAVLEDAEVKQRKEKVVEIWLKTLRSASLELENILDEVVTDAMLQRLHKERGTKHKVRAFFSSNHNPLMVHVRAADKVKTIRTKLDAIAAKGSQFNLISKAGSVDVGVGGETTNMETTSLVPTSMIYGRDAEVKTVVDQICSENIIGHDAEGIRVFAIWGMGGMGKTTLAQLVYNHERVKTHFELQSWVYVSNEFQVKKITRGIIESINKSPCQLSELDTMQKELENKLKGKRVFIVLDDVWIAERDVKKWEELSKALNSGAKGSIVMVTTRNKTTSIMMAKVPEFQHQLGCLSTEDSWSLFKKFAFASGTGRERVNIMELESIGEQIADKCKGLPLALKTLGGLMWSKSSANEWQIVKDSDVWELQENDILPALKLSYDDLLPHMKRCFGYCCLFPKGFKMRKDLLIELWMANGFIPPRGEVNLYVIGEEIFNCLVSRSFLQDVQEDENYVNLVCKMHDLMHDLARDVMRQDCSFTEPGKNLITPNQVLHFSSSCSNFSISDQDLKRLRSLRSLFIFVDHGYHTGNIISQMSNHVYLRVLHLDEIKESILPDSICKLKYLRYLSISGGNIHFLPESIFYLQNLQVLVLRGCWHLRKLPEGMRYMKNLRCLDNIDTFELDCMPVGMKELACLQRMGRFVVGKAMGAQIRELGELNLLGGRLEVTGLENVGGLEEAKSANMKHKANLISLLLDWWPSVDNLESDEEIRQHEEVLEGLEPNSSLRELSIQCYMGKMCPSWMMNLRNLVKISFSDCGRCESIASLGKLPSLRVIHVWGLHDLKGFRDDEFPSLQELKIVLCTGFVSLPSSLPKLERLDIYSVFRLVSLPSNLPKLQRLDIYNALRLFSLPSNLPELTWLSIRQCPQFRCLPDGLNKLISLRIEECDEELHGRCEKEIGEDWHKISHVPNLLNSRHGYGVR